MKGLIGKKVGMTQVFDEAGVVTPVTIIQAGPCFVTQVKDEQTDGYSAVQLGYGEVSPKRLTKGQQGHLGVLKGEKKGRRKGKGIPAVRHLREFRTSSAGEYQVGQQLTVAQFEIGEKSGRCRQDEGPRFHR